MNEATLESSCSWLQLSISNMRPYIMGAFGSPKVLKKKKKL